MAQAGRWSSPIPPEKPGPRSSMAMAHDALARIIHERSAFVNNAPTGAAWAARVGFDPAAAAGLKASPERRPANAGRVFTSS